MRMTSASTTWTGWLLSAGVRQRPSRTGSVVTQFVAQAGVQVSGPSDFSCSGCLVQVRSCGGTWLFTVAAGRWRLPVLPSRLPSDTFGIYAGLLAGVADGCGVQLHPALSISAVANPLAGSLTSCLLAGTGIRLLFHADRFTLVSGNILLVSCF